MIAIAKEADPPEYAGRFTLTTEQSSSTRLAIKSISSGRCSDLLKPVGFRRAGVSFWRKDGKVYQSVNFQASRWGTRDEGSFTINLCSTTPLLYRSFTSEELPARPSGLLWPFQKRIGSLTPEKRDLWWKVDLTTDVERLSAEVCTCLDEFALPYLKDMTGKLSRIDDGLWDGFAVPRAPLCKAVLLAESGNMDAAARILQEAIERHRGEPFEATIRRTAEICSLALT